MIPNKKQRSVQLHDFSMNPRPDVPRSQHNLSHGRKVPFSFSKLVPILCEFAIPGDTWNCRISAAARTAVPVVPVQDNWEMKYYSFFIPMRLLWDNAEKFFGEQTNPGDSTAFTIPTVPLNGVSAVLGSLYDYFGLPLGAALTAPMNINALPFRAYTRVFNEWFRDQNLQLSVYSPTNDGPDTAANYTVLARNKVYDYFTQALPWPQKGNTAISIPLVGQFQVKTNTTEFSTGSNPAGTGIGITLRRSNGGATPSTLLGANAGAVGEASATGQALTANILYPTNLYADATTGTAITINAIRQSVALQQYLEKDARGGTRYNEHVYNQYGVRTADARLDRPEFIGGGRAPINTVPIAQTTATGLTGGTTPIGTLAATGYVGEGSAGFTYSATEHGYLLTLVCATADLTYSQGLRRMWTMSTKYDVPVPVLANLGEQSILNKEIYAQGIPAQDDAVFGYVPRFDDYRYIPSQIVGLYRPAAAGNIAYWHSSEMFGGLPLLNPIFIADNSQVVLQRNFAAGPASANQQILADFYFNITAARPIPAFAVPGLKRF